MKVSPFTHADKIDEPILLIHGQVDNNAGTYTQQSERMFEALQANGATARLVLLPHESHGYLARESILHTLAEMFEWGARTVQPGGTAPRAGR
jgi:dipeptidyl aminopeptidase/acylaminoacyl peptidase